MKKKIIAAALAMLAVACVITACGGDETTYEPVEYTTDANGELYVTNIYGDLIPVTTGVDGSVELLEDLYTKTAEQVSEDISRLEQEAGANNGNNSESGSGNGGESGNNGNGGDSGNNGGNNGGSSGGIQIGSESPQSNEEYEAVIVW